MSLECVGCGALYAEECSCPEMQCEDCGLNWIRCKCDDHDQAEATADPAQQTAPGP